MLGLILMPKRRSVGKSTVTPCKHDLLNRILGREAGALTRISAVRQVYWYDLTAGDGVPSSGASHGLVEASLLPGVLHNSRPFAKGCSPGIMLHHAAIFGTKQLKPLVLNGFEMQPETYIRLLSNLRRELGEKGWETSEDSAPCWQIGSAVAQYHCADARSYSPEPEASLSTSAVFIYNDPNSIAEWCLTEDFISRCPKFTTSLSTLGCNASGLKRLPREKRELWFERTELIAAALQHWHDLCLFSVGNADQWAYLISAPKSWRAEITEDCLKAHTKSGILKEPEVKWLREDIDGFKRLEEKLFLTKKELSEDESND